MALIAWAASLAGRHFDSFPHDQHTSQQTLFAIDALPPEHPSVALFPKRQKGAVAFSNADGSMISLSSPKKVLAYFSGLLEEDLSMRLTNGTRNKLKRLAERWDSVTE